MLTRLLAELDFIDAECDVYSQQILSATQPYADALARLDTIPGIDRRTAENVLAEIGPDMAVFPSAGHLASWAALCPGHHASAGRQTHGTSARPIPGCAGRWSKPPGAPFANVMPIPAANIGGWWRRVERSGPLSPSRTPCSAWPTTYFATAPTTVTSARINMIAWPLKR
ncbi:MAG: IS110 family transposase [Acidobacteria bacterium]|nr:IS110 family transposase [Acidobacteriota bacterium]